MEKVQRAAEAVQTEQAKLAQAEAALVEVRQTRERVQAERAAAIVPAADGDAKARRVMDSTADKLDRLARDERDAVKLIEARRARVREAEATLKVAQDAAELAEIERLGGEQAGIRTEIISALAHVHGLAARHAAITSDLRALLRKRGERTQDAEQWVAGASVRVGLFDPRAFVWDRRLLVEDDADRMARVRQQSAGAEAELAARDRDPEALRRRLGWLDDRETKLLTGPRGATSEAEALWLTKLSEIRAERARLTALLPVEAAPVEEVA